MWTKRWSVFKIAEIDNHDADGSRLRKIEDVYFERISLILHYEKAKESLFGQWWARQMIVYFLERSKQRKLILECMIKGVEE